MPKTLLLADDSITIQRVVGITFANEDYEITTVDNGDDAVSKAAEINPDIVLADVIMPKKNGYEVCHAIKNNPELKDIPVLLLAGTFEAFDENRAREVGANGHITKPFESQALIDKVNALVEGGAAAPSPLSPKPQPKPTPATGSQPGPSRIPLAATPGPKPTPRMSQPPPPPAAGPTTKQPPAPPKPFVRPVTEPRMAPPSPAATAVPFENRPVSPSVKPLGSPPQPPRPSTPPSAKPPSAQPQPFDAATWESESKNMDFLDPLSDDMETTEASMPDEPISIEAELSEPIPLEPEPLDFSFSEETTDEQAWPSGPAPLEIDALDPQPEMEKPIASPPQATANRPKDLGDDFIPGSLAELSQNDRFDAENEDDDFLPVDISTDIDEETSDLDAVPDERPNMAPAHEFIPQAPKAPPPPKHEFTPQAPKAPPPPKHEFTPQAPKAPPPSKHEFTPQAPKAPPPPKPDKKPSFETVKLPSNGPGLSTGEAKKIATQTIEKIVWEIVPQLAETIIREEIEKLIREKLKD